MQTAWQGMCRALKYKRFQQRSIWAHFGFWRELHGLWISQLLLTVQQTGRHNPVWAAKQPATPGLGYDALQLRAAPTDRSQEDALRAGLDLLQVTDLDGQDHYRTLGLAPHARLVDIKKARCELCFPCAITEMQRSK